MKKVKIYKKTQSSKTQLMLKSLIKKMIKLIWELSLGFLIRTSGFWILILEI